MRITENRTPDNFTKCGECKKPLGEGKSYKLIISGRTEIICSSCCCRLRNLLLTETTKKGF